MENKSSGPIVRGFRNLIFGSQIAVASEKTSRSYLDSLIRTFENCRSGLSNETLESGESAAENFFLDLYNKELPRLEKAVEINAVYLSQEARKDFFDEVRAVLIKVVIPAYVRLAFSFTPRERNDFFLLPGKLHFLERVLWAIGGIILGAFVVWAPFIPLWSKEWVLPFFLAGLIFPDLRKAFSTSRYEGELNRMVARADQEIGRIEMAYLTGETLPPEISDSGDANLQTDDQQRSKQHNADPPVKN